MMKAYEVRCYRKKRYGKFIVFAERPSQARGIMFANFDNFGDTKYIDYRCKRVPELDGAYRGEIALLFKNNDEDTEAMIQAGYKCKKHGLFECNYCKFQKACKG